MNPNSPREEAITRRILPLLLGVTALLILPFGIMRLLRSEWLVGGMDLAVVVLFLAVAAYARRTGDVRRSALVLPLVAFPFIVFQVWAKGVVLVYWAFPAMAATFFVMSPRLAFVTCAGAAAALAIVLWPLIPAFHLATILVGLILVPAFVFFFARRASEQAVDLERLSLTDPLTGAGNRRALDARLAEVLALQARSKESTALLVLDLDSFKSVNDGYGHARGDQALVALSLLIRSQIRDCDGFYRFGGDEFVIVAPATTSEGALALAEKLRQLVEADAQALELPLTVTVGVAKIRADESVEHLLRRVDNALFAGKRGGRNSVHVAA